MHQDIYYILVITEFSYKFVKLLAKAVLFVYFNSIVVSFPKKCAGKEIFPHGYIDGNKRAF